MQSGWHAGVERAAQPELGKLCCVLLKSVSLIFVQWVDHKTGLCGFYAGQLLPTGDAKCAALSRSFEAAMYEKYKQTVESNRRVDIVTLDIDMPRMDGRAACQKIREYEASKGIMPTTIMLISGNYDEERVKEMNGIVSI